MSIKFHKKFQKALLKQPSQIQKKFFACLDIFVIDQFEYSLNNHALSGELKGWRSINVTGDIRVHFRESGPDIILMNIGSHSSLYK
jgi:mRNA-degrading endonuclease YafQ of YafQ-DinJ toxin-antitoxin module